MENKVIKVEGKEFRVDLNSMEDLLNSITYVTKQMEKAKEGLEGKELQRDYQNIKDRLDNLWKNSDQMRSEIFPKFEQKVEKNFKTLPREETIQALLFELEKVGNIEKKVSKINVRNIIVTAIVTAVVTIGTLSYTKIDDRLFYNFVKHNVTKESWIVKKDLYSMNYNKNGKVIFQKKEK